MRGIRLRSTWTWTFLSSLLLLDPSEDHPPPYLWSDDQSSAADLRTALMKSLLVFALCPKRIISYLIGVYRNIEHLFIYIYIGYTRPKILYVVGN